MESRQEQARRAVEDFVRAGERRATENVLAAFPELQGDNDFLLELVYLEYVLLEEAGLQCSTDELYSRFPGLGADLVRMIEVDRTLNKSESRETWPTIYNSLGAVVEGTSSDLPSQLQLGPYLLIDIIGQGGMGIVYRAKQIGLNRIVALKTLDRLARLDKAAVARFRSEAEVIAKIQHPNIVQVYEAGVINDVPYFSMEFVSGGTLANAIHENTLHPQVAARVLQNLALAVGFAHANGVIHRDLKPANVLLAPSTLPGSINLQFATPSQRFSGAASNFDPKIADFGLAKQLEVDSELSLTGGVLGTPSYMAPEQIESGRNSIEPACDIYSLGAILYHMLVGRPPFVASNAVETLRQLREEDPVPPRNLDRRVPRELETICLTCLQKDPRGRYPTANDLADDLGRFLNSMPIKARRTNWSLRTIKWIRRHPAAASLMALALVSMVAMSALWYRAESHRLVANRASDLAQRAVYAQTIRLAQFDLNQGNWQSTFRRLEESKPEYRGFEWQFLRDQCGQPLFSQQAPMIAGSVTLSPDGKLVAVGSHDGFGSNKIGDVRVWDIESGRELYRFAEHSGPVNAVCFSPDGQYLAAGGVIHGSGLNRMGGLFVWRLSDGQVHFSDKDFDVYALDYSLDGSKLAAGGFKRCDIVIYSTDGRKVNRLKGHKSFITSLAFRSDGTMLASCSRDGSLRVWSLLPNLPHPIVQGGSDFGDLREVEWTPDGREIVASDFQKALHTFSLREDGSIVEKGLSESKGIITVKLSPDGQYLVTASTGGIPIIADRFSHTELGVVKTFGHARSIAFDKLGRRIAVGAGRSVQVWDMEECLNSVLPRPSPTADVGEAVIHPSQNLAALVRTVNIRRGAKISGQPRIDIVDLDSGKTTLVLPHGKVWPACVAFSPNGEVVASGDGEGKIRMWNTADGSRMLDFTGHEGVVSGVAFVGTVGEALITCGRDRSLRSWNVRTAKQIANKDISSPCAQLVSSRNGAAIALRTESGDVRLFRGESLQEIGHLPSRVTGITSMQISDDGSRLAMSRDDSAIEIWDLNKINRLSQATWELRGHTDSITGMAFGHDGLRLASGGRDMSIRVWDVTSGQELISVPMHSQGLLARILFTPDDRSIRVWDLDSQYHLTADSEENKLLPMTDRDWHIWQLAIAQKTDRKFEKQCLPDRFAEEVHLTQLLELDPLGDWQKQRGIARLEAGKFDMAYADFLEIYNKLVPSDLYSTSELQITLVEPSTWSDGVQRAPQSQSTSTADTALLSKLATCSLGAERMDDYRHWCQELETAYRAAPTVAKLNTYAWYNALAPNENTNWREIRGMFAQAGESAKKPFFQNTLALVEYRAGDYAAALKLCRQGIKTSTQTNAPFDWLIATLCYAKQSNLTEARKMRAKAVDWMQQQQSLNSAGLRGESNFEGNSTKIKRLLLEVDSMLGVGR